MKKLLQRGLYYIQTGSSLGGLPLSLLNFATIFYYNAIANISLLQSVFTSFYLFLGFAIFVIPVFFGLLGYFYKKRSGFYMGQIEVDVEANEYQNSRMTPVSIPFWEMQCKIADKLGIDCADAKEILRRSGSKNI